MPKRDTGNIEAFIDTLPNPAGARAFIRRLETSAPSAALDRERDPSLLGRILTLAGHSPFLAETLLRHPEHIAWLKAETRRGFDRIKSTEQLSEELARFTTRMIETGEPARLARFKRRELLRIYLRDCLGIATLSEITEELSNLADVILGYSLARAHQEMVNLYGAPLTQDPRTRVEPAEFAIVSLGKLGCRELNYASDIDLLFLYSGAGKTSGDGRRPESVVSNKEFFTGVAERLVQMIGRSSDEGAVYRIDLRLRPYGRDGDMIWEVGRAADYYHTRAQNWERQALIRARKSAGSETVAMHFLDLVRDAIFTRDALPETLGVVRRAKEKIDRKEAARMRGLNVKLGPGGIREIEFIVQALQLKHGGREPWVRSAQTLIVLARLAEKSYLTEPERARLSAAYTFLRTVEHRLQMEHGAQTHTLPSAHSRLELLARRCGYGHEDDPVTHLMRDLEMHTSAVRAIYNRVFREADQSVETEEAAEAAPAKEAEDESSRLIKQAATGLQKVLALDAVEAPQGLRNTVEIEALLLSRLPETINPSRALRNLIAWTESFGTYSKEYMEASGWAVSGANWVMLIERLTLVLSSQYLSHLLVSRPGLASALVENDALFGPPDFSAVLRNVVDREPDAASKTDVLRRAWYRLVVGIGYRDLSETNNGGAVVQRREGFELKEREVDHLRAINLEQTFLAEAVLRIAAGIALESTGIARQPSEQLGFTILGLGRLGHAGMDYGSDLDLLVVYDDAQAWPPEVLSAPRQSSAWIISQQEFFAKLASQMVRVLSSITREGLLYRTDLRLRPEGKSGPVAVGLSSLVSYITSRASAWEHSAYLKAREVAGDLRFGERVRKAIVDASFNAASRNESLREELADIRARLVREKVRGLRPNIKWGRGGMTDVYFVTRYLQLRDRIYFPPEEGTKALIAHLGERGSLNGDQARTLFEGYTFLRRLDHWMRVLLDRPGPVLPPSSIALGDLARGVGVASAEELEHTLTGHTVKIREVYDAVFEQG